MLSETGEAETDSVSVELQELRDRLATLERTYSDRYRGPVVKDPPVRECRAIIKDSGNPGFINRLLIGTATTGLLRIEWVMGRYGQIVPPNWSFVQMNQYLNAYVPLRYQVADAQNLIVREAVNQDFEWLLLVEHDVILPQDTFKRLDEYMREAQVPVVSGLYYTRHRPSVPLVYRGRGTSFYDKWEFGDKVWVDGVPTGCLLIHCALLRAMWEESEEYIIQHPDGRRDVTRKVFDTPRHSWHDPETMHFNIEAGTSDLNWCTRVMENGFFEKSGWKEFEGLEYPFLIDTNIFCKHINMDGEQFP